jgi:hypothetical protein
MAMGCGLLMLLEAKPGRGPELATFLEHAQSAAAQESATLSWCALGGSPRSSRWRSIAGTRWAAWRQRGGLALCP